MGRSLGDLTGKTFGHWNVIGFCGYDTKNRKVWLLNCACGRKKEVLQSLLVSGKSKSCGCRSGKDLSGRIFGDLTAIEPVIRADGVRVWRCKCSCGNESLVRAQSLVEGHTKSCGCNALRKRRETLHSRRKKAGRKASGLTKREFYSKLDKIIKRTRLSLNEILLSELEQFLGSRKKE